MKSAHFIVLAFIWWRVASFAHAVSLRDCVDQEADSSALLSSSLNHKRLALNRTHKIYPDEYPTSSSFVYEGRWQIDHSVASSDWPATAVHFQIRGGTVKARLWGGSVSGGTKVGQELRAANGTLISYGEFYVGRFGGWYETPAVPGGSADTFLVSIRKLTEAHFFPKLPLGIGRSSFEFGGVRLSQGASLLGPPPRPKRRIEVVGDSDTTAWGTEGFLSTKQSTCVKNWVKNQNCGSSWAVVLAQRLAAEVQVVATMGKGIYSNAETFGYPSGPPLPGVYDRTLAAHSQPKWNFGNWLPDVVLIRAGTNDFASNSPPTTDDFKSAYTNFIRSIFRTYDTYHKNVTVINLCGGAYPSDRGRDYVCPLISSISELWKNTFSEEGRVEYVHIPQGIATDEDRGCMDHPRVAAHAHIAEYLDPHMRTILGWDMDS